MNIMFNEIHRFNKSIQDIFLPYMEDGTIILIAATTANLSFELNNALLSRCIVYTLNKLDETSLAKIVDRVEKIKGKRYIQAASATVCNL
jgi:putative ATPase